MSDISSNPVEVLLIDENVLFREGLERLLSGEPDFKVLGQAGQLPEAVELATTLRPDLVLLDIELANGTGLDTLRSIRAARSESTVVILTNEDSNEYLFAALRAGEKMLVVNAAK